MVPPEGFEAELSSRWALTGETMRSPEAAHGGSYSLRLGGGFDHVDTATLEFVLPDEITLLSLSFYWLTDSIEKSKDHDTLRVTLEDASGQELVEVTELDGSTQFSDWLLFARDLTSWAEEAHALVFRCTVDPFFPSIFYVDDLELSVCSRSLPEGCNSIDYYFHDEFIDSPVSDWQEDLGRGSYTVEDSTIEMQAKEGLVDRFPVLWNNDAFPPGYDFLFETRFRHSAFTAYGTTIGIGSETYDGNRYFEGAEAPPGIEDILSIHHLDAWFRISLFDRVTWWGEAEDTDWHIVRVLRLGLVWVLSVDDVEVGRTWSDTIPKSLYIGNPAIEIWWGTWTHLHVDYVRITYCAGQGRVVIWIPLILKE